MTEEVEEDKLTDWLIAERVDESFRLTTTITYSTCAKRCAESQLVPECIKQDVKNLKIVYHINKYVAKLFQNYVKGKMTKAWPCAGHADWPCTGACRGTRWLSRPWSPARPWRPCPPRFPPKSPRRPVETDGGRHHHAYRSEFNYSAALAIDR